MNKTLVILGLSLGTLAYANNVPDTGPATQAGDILYFNGTSGNDQGTWAQPSSVPGLQGAIGPQGPQGIQGVQGTAGVNGANGTNGVDGATGAQGAQGVKGDKGDKGDKGTQGVKGDTGKDGNNVGPKRAFNGELDARLSDTKYTSFYIYDKYGFDDSPGHDLVMDGRNSEYGFKFIIKIGKSYEETLIEKQTREIKALELRLSLLGVQ